MRKNISLEGLHPMLNGWKGNRKLKCILKEIIHSLPFTAFICEKFSQKIIKILKNLTPEYNLNFCWQTIKLSSVITPKLKFIQPSFSKPNVIYEFKCECGDNYIGETRRRLIDRISDHNRKSGGTVVYAHREACQVYQSKLTQRIDEVKYKYVTILRTKKVPPSERRKEMLEFYKNHFKIVSSNFRKQRDRKVSEAIFIKMKNPNLNKQIDFTKKKNKFGGTAILKLI